MNLACGTCDSSKILSTLVHASGALRKSSKVSFACDCYIKINK